MTPTSTNRRPGDPETRRHSLKLSPVNPKHTYLDLQPETILDDVSMSPCLQFLRLVVLTGVDHHD